MAKRPQRPKDALQRLRAPLGQERKEAGGSGQRRGWRVITSATPPPVPPISTTARRRPHIFDGRWRSEGSVAVVRCREGDSNSDADSDGLGRTDLAWPDMITVRSFISTVVARELPTPEGPPQSRISISGRPSAKPHPLPPLSQLHILPFTVGPSIAKKRLPISLASAGDISPISVAFVFIVTNPFSSSPSPSSSSSSPPWPLASSSINHRVICSAAFENRPRQGRHQFLRFPSEQEGRGGEGPI